MRIKRNPKHKPRRTPRQKATMLRLAKLGCRKRPSHSDKAKAMRDKPIQL